MATLRHWKQHFDPKASMKFRRRTKVSRAGVAVAEPGDPVPQELVDHLGPTKLRRWWEAGILELALEETTPEPEPEEKDEAPTEELPEGIQPLGNGWYQVGEKKVRGLRAARKALES